MRTCVIMRKIVTDLLKRFVYLNVYCTWHNFMAEWIIDEFRENDGSFKCLNIENEYVSYI